MSDAELLVNGRAYSGWTSITVERSIENFAGTFAFGVSALSPSGEAASDLHDGQPAAVRLNGDTVITGFIDGFEIEHDAKKHEITVTGRDATGDLVDCSAAFVTRQWFDQGMLAIVRDMVKDYSIDVVVQTDLGKPFATWNIEPGETIFENIDKLARHRGVLAMSDGAGHLLLTKPGTEVVATRLQLGENILAGKLTRDCKKRFSDYTVLGQRQRDDENSAEDASQPKGRARDAWCKRKRYTTGYYEDANATLDTLTKRAAWQSNVSAAQAQRVIITVQGWSHAAGLWVPNQLVAIDDERLRLSNATLLIAGVKHQLSAQGTTTELTLAPRDAFLVDKQPEEIE